jgi:hypothetical protein
MRKTVEARSAGKRSLASGIVAVGTADFPEVSATAQEIRATYLRTRHRCRPSLVSTYRELAFNRAESCR